MSDWVLATEQQGYTRHFGPEALPVTIGGDADCDLVLADVAGSVQIGRLDEVFFVQPGRFTDNVRVDGELLRGSRRLADGNEIALDTARIGCAVRDGRLRLTIEARITAGDTAPPDFDALSRDPGSEVTVSPIAFNPKARNASEARRVSKAALVAYAAFAALIVLGWLAFTSKSVRFETTPLADSVELPDTWFKLRIGDRYLLRPGPHRIAAALEGYYPIDETLAISRNADQTIALEFVRLPGLIAFATEPEATAEVHVDGELIGTTPIVDYELRPGTHQVQFTAERYLTELVTIEVEGGHERDAVTAALTPSWAPVSFSSRPAGAEIRVDGRLLDVTPAELELTAGERTIEISRAGYNSWQRQILVVADEAQVLPEVTLALADARISLRTEPPDASISLNGEHIGRTPFDLSVRPNVLHTLRLSKAGYENEAIELNLGPGARETISVPLLEQLGIVEVSTTPEGAEVLVNGEPAGTTPLSLELMAIEQTIVVRLDGYAEDGITVTPRKGYSQLLPFELELLDDATGGGYPRAVTTGSGTRLRLIPAGTVQMGASRSDGATTFEINRYRRVEISSAFYLAETEMTNAEFRRCQPDHDSGSFNGESLNQDLQPVVRVTVQEAFACLNQLSIADGLQPVYEPRDGMLVPNHARSGYRLPTEAEFALALRVSGREGEAPLKFPWGPEPLAPADRIENVGDLSARQLLENTLRTYTDGYPVSAPVGSLLPNAAGLYDMGGNVSEWVQDFYDPLEDFADEVIVDPRGPATGRANIVRGPSWRSWREERLRLSFVDFQDVGREDLGFRIARNLN